MDKTAVTEKIVYSFPKEQNRVDVLCIQHSNGDEYYEFRIYQHDSPIYTSANGYQTPGNVVNDGFKWIADNL